MLTTIKSITGQAGHLKVADGKSWLSSFGARGARAASALRKLSSARNRQAHPLAQQMIAEIDLLAFGGVGNTPEKEATVLTDGGDAKPDVKTSALGGAGTADFR